jgi:hypothetical protein
LTAANPAVSELCALEPGRFVRIPPAAARTVRLTTCRLRCRCRFFLGLLATAGAVTVALTAGGWLPIMLGLIAFWIIADAVVRDTDLPLFSREVPESKRQRLRGRSQ